MSARPTAAAMPPPAPTEPPKNAGQFTPGTNVNPLSDASGMIFRRGPDHISRGSIKLLLGQVLLDEREEIYRGLVRTARGKNGAALQLQLVKDMGDRLEGRPVQVTQVSSVRTTIFEKGDGAPGRQPETTGKRITQEETVTRAPLNSPLAGAEVARL